MTVEDPERNVAGFLQEYAKKFGTVKFRRDVEEIARSYRHSWDVLAELLQNAVDAIRKMSAGKKSGYKGALTIGVNRKTNTLTIEDNGVGIPHAHILEALLPGESFKELGKDLGYKGYGLTFVAFASRRLRITSTHGGKRSVLELVGAIDWLSSEKSAEPPPDPTWIEKQVPTKEHSGTKVEVTLACGQYETMFRAVAALDAFFDWASKKRPLEYVLRTRTAVGNAEAALGGEPRPDIVTTAHIAGQAPFLVPYKYLLPTESRWVRDDLEEDISEYMKKYEDGSYSQSAKAFRGLVYQGTKIEVGVKANIRFVPLVVVCGRSGMSRLASEYDVGDTDDLKVTTGVHLALGGMPTGIVLEDWSKHGAFDQRFFVLLNANLELSEQLDSGRKGISNYFGKQMVNKVEDLLRANIHGKRKVSLRKLAQHMTAPEDDSSEDVSDASELIARRKGLPDISDLGLGLEKTPVDENEVIALFFALVGAGLLQGYVARFVSQSGTYDAAFSFSVPLTEDMLSPVHPLGLGGKARRLMEEDGAPAYSWRDQRGVDVDVFVAEFKTNVQDIASQKSRQRIRDMELLIAWDYDESCLGRDGFSIEPLKDKDRRLLGVTHRLYCAGEECRCIVLRTVLDRLKPSLRKGSKPSRLAAKRTKS